MIDRLIMQCPQCGDPNCEADGVDNGVGIQQCGPYACEACGYVEKRVELELIDLDNEGLDA